MMSVATFDPRTDGPASASTTIKWALALLFLFRVLPSVSMIDCGGLQMDYYDAKHFCDGLNATLVYVDSQAENDDIVEMALLNDSESTEPNRNGRCEGKAFSKSVSFFCVCGHPQKWGTSSGSGHRVLLRIPPGTGNRRVGRWTTRIG